jgi:hypothetical protein
MTLCDRPFYPPGAEIAAQGFDLFEKWRAERDPDGEISVFRLVDEYAALAPGWFQRTFGDGESTEGSKKDG